ncbi:flagellar biosynthetic protein FliR [bacterium]|nr:flagellar biosynthetic protein FliR [bacterium]
MNNNIEVFLNSFEIIFLIFCRVSGMFVSAPFYGAISIPMTVKNAIAFFIALTMFPIIAKMGYFKIPPTFFGYSLLIVQELSIGLIIGFCTTIVFTLFAASGELYSTQLGLGMINVVDPLSQIQIPIIGQLLGIVGTLIFFLCQAHYLLLMAIFKSYELLPSLTVNSFSPLCKNIIDLFVNSFILAFSLALPIIGVVFICTVAIGLSSKASPQMNIMVLGWPIQILLGFITLTILLPIIFNLGYDAFDNLFERISKMFLEMGASN